LEEASDARCDMSGSNFAVIFARTRAAYLEHE
jgi:hypothetical protein